MSRKPVLSEKGQGLVELTVCVVVILVLLAACFDITRIALALMQMQDSATDAMIFASVSPAACSDIASRAVPVDWENADELNVLVEIDGTPCEQATVKQACSGKDVTVRVEYDSFTITTPFVGAVLGKQEISISRNVSGVIISPACPQ